MTSGIWMVAVLAVVAAEPAQAEWTDAMTAELGALVTGFRAGEDVATDRIVELSDAAAETGRIPLGVFDGALRPLEGPVTLTSLPAIELNCETLVDADIPVPGFPPRYTETIGLTRPGDGTTALSYLTIDPDGELSMSATYDGSALNLTEMTMSDTIGDLRLIPTPDGGFTDEISGERIQPTSADAQMLGAMVDAIYLLNPGWFITETEVRAGSPWLIEGGQDDLMEAMVSLISSGFAGGGTVEPRFLHSAITGVTDVGGAPAVVFEVLLDAEIAGLPGNSPIHVRVAGAEVYEIARFGRVVMTTEIQLETGSVAIGLDQRQSCRISAE